MSQQPPQRKKPAVRSTGQVSQEAQAKQAAEEEELYEEEESLMASWMRQSPSWLTSMVVHMILILTLALIVIGEQMGDAFKELTINKVEEAPDDPLEEDKPLNEDQPEINDSEVQEEVDVVSEIDMEVETPELMIETDANDMTLEAAEIVFDPSATVEMFSGSSTAPITGMAESGLGSRTKGGRAAAVRRGGGNGASEAAVKAALEWLKNHQNRNGSWSWNHTAGDRCSGYANPGDKTTKMGATGLALLPFLGAGYTHTYKDGDDGEYQDVVKRALKYLVGNMQVANNAGRLYDAGGPNHEHMYSHGIAACAVVEAYGMSQDNKLKSPAQLSLNYIVQAQHPQNGGWLYVPRAGGDTSVVGWQIMALKSGRMSYLEFPSKVTNLANAWLDSVQSDFYEGGEGIGSRYGYRLAQDRHPSGWKPNPSGSTTAIGLLCRNYLGTPKGDPGLKKGVQWLAQKGPKPSDMYYNYYATMVMFQNDGPKGDMWKAWNERMRDGLINSQVKAGADKGSWYFAGNHGDSGGRVYNTALAAMTLQVYYRYGQVYKDEGGEEEFPME